MKKIRVNITIDEKLLRSAQKKLGLFGGKLSTLFNAYLSDFVKSMDEPELAQRKEMAEKIKKLEARIDKLEKTSK